MSYQLECPACAEPLHRPDDDPEALHECVNHCRERLSGDEWTMARWRLLEPHHWAGASDDRAAHGG